jgi:putative ABC transport system permease protein
MNPNWKQIVREHLAVLRLPPEREIEIVEEQALHLEAAYEDALADGLSAVEAEARAAQSYDWRLLECELSRAEQPLATRTLQPSLELIERKGGIRMESFIQDMRFGARMLLKNPGFMLIAVLTLALGIGANTAIFSVVDATLLRPLPYPESERLVTLWSTSKTPAGGRFNSCVPDYRAWREQNQVFEGLGAFWYGDFNLTSDGLDAERVQGAFVTANFFSVLGVAPALGRGFQSADEEFGQHQVVLLSHELWQRRYGGDPQLVGRGIKLGGVTYTVVGVMPRGMAFLDNSTRPELWTPLSFAAGDNKLTRDTYFLRLVGRLKPGVSIEQATTDVSAIAERMKTEFGEVSGAVVSLREQIIGNVRRGLLVLLGAVAFVLLVACVNVANLLLARAAVREREFAVRAALGASRVRIIRQLLIESIPLGLLGGGAGLLLAYWGLELMRSLLPASLPRHNTISIDGRVLGFTLLASGLTVIAFGLLPAFQTARDSVREALNEGGRGGTAGRRRSRLRDALVVIEMALALVLLVGAGLMLRSFARFQQVDTGFSATNVLTMRIPLPEAKYPLPPGPNAPPAAGLHFFNQLLERVKALPGVESASVTTMLPLGAGSGLTKRFSVEGHPLPSSLDQVPAVELAAVSPDYFNTLGITVRRGRGFTPYDRAEAQQVAVINETLARRSFPNEDPLGKTIWLGPPESLLPPGLIPPGFRFLRRTIVGVIADVKSGSLDTAAGSEVCVPLEQYRPDIWYNTMMLAVRSPLPADSLTAALREQVRALDRDQPITSIATMEERLSRRLSEPRFSTLLLGLFAAIAMLLAAIGIYGVMSYAVTQRLHEIGIHMALGAARRDVLRLVIGQGMKRALLGVGIGLAGALGLTRLMQQLLFGVSATDPLTFAGVALLLTLAALLACWIPARRAAQVDPMIALRHD